LSSTENSSSGAKVAEHLAPPTLSKRKPNDRPLRGSTAIREMFSNARSVAFIPFWDYERSRWFAGCLCWSNDPYRLLSASVDLTYFKIFSHSIMRELSRLDAVSLNQVSFGCSRDVLFPLGEKEPLDTRKRFTHSSTDVAMPSAMILILLTHLEVENDLCGINFT
jgi:hypothetical protein